MRIQNEALDEFIALYKDQFGEELNRVDALEMASQLITLYRLLSKKLSDEHRVTSRGDAEASTP